MPKVSERERIAALEAKLKQLKVRQQRKEARVRAVEGRLDVDLDQSRRAGVRQEPRNG